MRSIARTRVAFATGVAAIIASGVLARSASAAPAGDAAKGALVFQACVACHSVAPGEQLTGPSLASVWQHKAGTVAGFDRYSDAMTRANVVWTEPTLEQWLTDPQSLVPGTSMTFPGLRNPTSREDVIAYLRAVSEGKAPRPQQGEMAMGMRPARVDLKLAPPPGQVLAIGHCKDAYTIRTADGKVSEAWEYNLRFKTDSSESGPRKGKPVIVGAGMQGDRASIVFAAPAEISTFIHESCP